ncbi:hypothetical protein CYV26_03575 [Carnobacterium maltaromaticum]|nr:hypothetical protein CYV33_01040 [Carnobacterium maltaromaticum]PLS40107.1 hypothetical protein CYV30_01035 [Carnobacterium maltaromaticum]PLS40444.1 hypothetical protein CYV31_01035 [Carnobacterium maltaromaticum]PLS46087.1 hypothetical protein CYV28_01035 [Carnobacterium maltaromaticum]PLS47239.1 hypothetical protein CYV27_03045 [Carnobacterium maltaromaticum]
MQGNKQIDIHFIQNVRNSSLLSFLHFFHLFFARAKRHNELFIRLVLLYQLLEKKMKIREDKKRPINFPYFLDGANRHNELFIKGVINYDVQKF